MATCRPPIPPLGCLFSFFLLPIPPFTLSPSHGLEPVFSSHRSTPSWGFGSSPSSDVSPRERTRPPLAHTLTWWGSHALPLGRRFFLSFFYNTEGWERGVMLRVLLPHSKSCSKGKAARARTPTIFVIPPIEAERHALTDRGNRTRARAQNSCPHGRILALTTRAAHYQTISLITYLIIRVYLITRY